MYSVYILILCSLLQVSNEGTTPGPPDRIPIRQPTPYPSAVPMQTTPPSVSAPPAAPKQLHLRNGVLVLPTNNHVTLPAPERAVLRFLGTEQRDAAGNILRDDNDNPIMIPITKGMNVFKGQVLGKFEDRELHSTLKMNQAQLDVANAEKGKTIEVIYAAQSVLVAMDEVRRMLAANERIDNTFSKAEVDRAKLLQAQAEAYLELQKYNIEEIKTREITVRESELERTKVQIELRQLVTPIDGMIVEINAAEGEWLREGDQVLEIMQLDTLWVMVRVSVTEYEASDLDGKQAIIPVTLANGRSETFQGTVIFCKPFIAVGGTFEVYIEVQNRRVGNFWLLQPGRDGLDIVIPL